MNSNVGEFVRLVNSNVGEFVRLVNSNVGEFVRLVNELKCRIVCKACELKCTDACCLQDCSNTRTEVDEQLDRIVQMMKCEFMDTDQLPI